MWIENRAIGGRGDEATGAAGFGQRVSSVTDPEDRQAIHPESDRTY